MCVGRRQRLGYCVGYSRGGTPLVLDRLLFRPDISPSWRGSCESHALPPVADDSGWLLLLLSLLLSAAGPVPQFHGHPADDSVTPRSSSPSPGLPLATRPRPSCPRPLPEPDSCRTIRQTGPVMGRRSRSRVTPKAPLTGSGCREHSYGGLGGGHPHFHPHAPKGSDARPLSPIRLIAAVHVDGNEASRFGQPPQPRSIHAGSGSWLVRGAGSQRGRRLRSSVSVPCSSNSIARAYIVPDPVGASSGLSDRRFRPVGL
jgi:hypothetical protein